MRAVGRCAHLFPGWGWCVLILAAVLCPGAIAFTRFYNVDCQTDGYPVIYLEWPPILQGGGAVNGGVYVNPNCDDAECPGSAERDAIIRAMDTWTAAPFHFTFVFSGDTTAMPYDGSYDIDLTDGVSVFGWDGMDGRGGMLARAWVFFECWGEILEADIQFDQAETWSETETVPVDAYDVESVALHELGHVLGLNHASYPAVMYGSMALGTNKRVLTQDDVNGGIAIYGPPPSAVEHFEALEPGSAEIHR